MADAENLLRKIAHIAEQLREVASAIVGGDTPAVVEVSSLRLPIDARDREHFNRECRAGRVRGAYKRGRVWIAELEAWNARAPAPRPRGLPDAAPPRTRKAMPRPRMVTTEPAADETPNETPAAPAVATVSLETLRELGATWAKPTKPRRTG